MSNIIDNPLKNTVMTNETNNNPQKDAVLDNRLGTPMKKVDGLSCDKKKAESEHLHAFREDVQIGDDVDENEEDNEKCK